MPRCVTCKEYHSEDNFKVFNRATHQLEISMYCRSCRKKHRAATTREGPKAIKR